GGKALRYGIGVGREGFTWSGVKNIERKAEWPDWTPPTRDDCAATLSASLRGGRRQQSSGCPRDVSERLHLSHTRHQSAGYHWTDCLLGPHPHDERGRDRPL